MTDLVQKLIAEFESECGSLDVSPTSVLEAAGVHKSLWWKWKAGKISPSLRNWEAARQKLGELSAKQRRSRKRVAA